MSHATVASSRVPVKFMSCAPLCILTFLAVAMITLPLASRTQADEPTAIDFSSKSPTQLETQLTEIDRQLATLAKPEMRTGVGAVGYRSLAHKSNTDAEWIQIQLAEKSDVSEIVLVPSIWRDTETGFRADGFPIDYNVIVGTKGGAEQKTVASFSAGNHLLPRVAPVRIQCKETDVAWVRIAVNVLSQRAWDDKFILQLAEVSVFSGDENVALHGTVEVPSGRQKDSGAFQPKFLVDGFVPYIMDAQVGQQSIAFVGSPAFDETPTITVDLGDVHDLSRVHLHSAELSDMVPQSEPSDFAIPRHTIIEGCLNPTFDAPILLTELKIDSSYQTAPILTKRFPAKACRYVRLRIIEPYASPDVPEKTVIGLAEIELFAHSNNVAINRRFKANFPAYAARTFSALSDGNNLYGSILSTREWFTQLETRHNLETLRPRIDAELSRRYRLQRDVVYWLVGLAAALAIAATFAVLIGWVSRQRAILLTRQRIAADLHDELGANIHAIGLLSDMACKQIDSPDELKPLMERLQELTRRTGTSAASFTNLLESEQLCQELQEEMRRSSSRILAGITHQLCLAGERETEQLSPRRRIDLFLFYKECLTNILRHSGATNVETQLSAGDGQIVLQIWDDGIGMDESNRPPLSLKRRAKLLGGRLSVTNPKGHGTFVELSLKTKRRSLFS